MGLSYGVAGSEGDLKGILELQRRNLPEGITAGEMAREGFVTVRHDLDLLRRMNELHPHVVARDGDRVVAYALVMLRAFAGDIPVLFDMFSEFENIDHDGRPLAASRSFVMGQICIDKPYRGLGVFPGLYEEMKKQMKDAFDFCLTEVDETNPRSLRAHLKAGFVVVREYIDRDGVNWSILLLNLRD